MKKVYNENKREIKGTIKELYVDIELSYAV